MTPLTHVPTNRGRAAATAAATKSEKVSLVGERPRTAASARSPLPSNESPVPPPYLSPSSAEEQQKNERASKQVAVGGHYLGTAAAAGSGGGPAAAASAVPAPATAAARAGAPILNSTLLDALEETRLNLQIAVIERRQNDVQQEREAHALQRKAEKARRTIASLQEEVAAEKRLNAEFAARESTTKGELCSGGEAAYLPEMTPIKLSRGDRVDSWKEKATRKQLKEICRRHAKESDALAIKIAAVTEKLEARNTLQSKSKSGSGRALKEQLKGLVSLALQNRRRHDRELQQVSRQLLNRANAVYGPCGGGAASAAAAADPTLAKEWASLMARIDFMPQGLRELVHARVFPVLETKGTKAAVVVVDKVEQEYLEKIWKETQESGQNSVQEALDLVHSVARMQPEAAAGEKQNEEMEEKKKRKETKETKKKKKAQEKPEGGGRWLCR